MTVDWYLLVEKYNIKNNTSYNSPKELLKMLYKKEGSTTRVGDHLIISNGPVRKKMKELDLPIKKKGWPKNSPLRNKILTYRKNRFEKMTVSQVAKLLGGTEQGVRNIFNKLGYKYKKRNFKNDK